MRNFQPSARRRTSRRGFALLKKYGFTPLHLAADWNSLDVARLLIEHGADTDGIDLSLMDDEEDA
tara:strand:- start:78 stop:272 length:195 start_codon:yes stop_codon:yes gene_type:complete